MAAGQGRLFISPSSLKLWDLCRNQACSGTRPAMRSATVLFGLCLILACTVALISLFLVPEKAGSSQLLGGDNGFASAFLSTLHSYQHSQASLLRKEQQLSAAQSNVMNVAQQLASTDPPSGITYSPSSQVGVSSEDQSPEIPRSFLLQEDRADARMKKLQRELKKTQSQQEEITKKIKDLNDFVASELTDVKSDVRERNTKLTDDISSASHDVVGVPGPPGLPGLPGQDGQAGQDGFDGTQGPRGTQGAPGPLGPAGSEGPQGQQGLRGPGGYGGGTGNTGPGGGEGDTGLIGGDASWAPSPYFCPSSSNEWTRLVDCNRNSCKLETNYDGVWGVVCGWYFSQVDADVVCRGLGFEEGGTATYRFGNSRTGPIWLSNVRCNGNEGDIGDCPKTCGGDGCDRHVGLCCWGQAIGEKGVRVSVPETYKTVQEFRDNCHFPPTCQESGGPKVALHQNCGGAQSGGWQSALGVGSYPRMDGGTCDNDAGRCIIPNCGLQNGDLSSMEVPAGVSVTLYSQANFKGSFVSYTGPMDVDCLVWDGWNDATRSLKISQAEQKAASEFKMRIFKSTAQLSSMPSLAVMNFVGEAVVPVISFHSGDEFRKYVPGTPDQNFVAVFYGTVSILSSGKYTFCSNSDDGSYVWVDNVMIVNNGGLHGDQRQCGPTDLSAGLHRIQVSVFQAGGAVGIFFSYSGPDTQGQYTRPRSESSTDGIPPLPPKSSWTMRLFSSPVHLGSFPDWTTLNYLGSRDGVELVKFNSAQDIRNLFANMPDSNYAWAFYGSITVQFAGQYSFCVFSHDGSVLIVDRELVIGDTGAHGATRSCGSRSLATGDHDIWIEGFTGDTAATIVATYAGPDTGGGEILIHSIGQIGWVPECPAPPSEWTLSVYSSATYLYCMPDLSVLTYVGRAKISIINFNSQHDFAQVVSQTPGENFAWSFDGTVSIHNAGAYTFCTTSDDGSFIYVDGSMIADDSNLHGMVQRCATREMTVGTHSVQVTGFQIWGGVGEQANYYGPDTGGVLRWLRSSKGTDPNVGKASQFTICAFQAWYFMGSMPSLAGLWYNGRGQMPVVNMWDINQFRQYVPNLPEYYCGWGIYGKLEIQRAGQYTLCTTSDDGSREYVDGVWVVNNDGLHGMSQACGSMFLSSGSHLLYMEGFQSGGGLGMQATYAGPDTNGLVLVRSGVACSPDKDGCH